MQDIDLLLEMNELSLLSTVPYFKTAKLVVTDPEALLKDSKNISSAQQLIKIAKSNPSKTVVSYSNTIDTNIEMAKAEIGADKFFKYIKKDKIPMSTKEYAMYLYYRLVKELKINSVVASLVTIMCTSIGGFWLILSLGRYQFLKQTADRLVERIKRRGVALTTIIGIATLIFQVGLLVLVQIALTLGAGLLIFKKAALKKILGTLLYIFIASITALIILFKSAAGVSDSREAIKYKKL